VDSVCQVLKQFFAKSRGQQGLSSYFPYLFESTYIRTKGILKYNGKFLDGISSDQKGGVGTPLSETPEISGAHVPFLMGLVSLMCNIESNEFDSK
jgi:hypothetical protein